MITKNFSIPYDPCHPSSRIRLRIIRRVRRFRTHAFTLVEVLLVLAILGVIAGLAVPRLLSRQKYANEDATRLTIKGVEHALKLYAIDHLGEYPSEREGLQALIEPPRGKSPNWRGPYLDSFPKDSWGKPLTYRFPGKTNSSGYDILSSGQDGVIGTSDDIVNSLQ